MKVSLIAHTQLGKLPMSLRTPLPPPFFIKVRKYTLTPRGGDEMKIMNGCLNVLAFIIMIAIFLPLILGFTALAGLIAFLLLSIIM